MEYKFRFSFRKKLISRLNGGVILILAALLAVIMANSSYSSEYLAFWQQSLVVQLGDLSLFSHHGHPMTFLQFINDALMAVFFFSVGLEIKREILVGELSSFRKALLPIIAAVGGMVVPVGLFRLFADSGAASLGSAIPMATDIAFSLGILVMLGSRVPVSLKIFLTTLAVADDIGGIVVIALFYSKELMTSYLIMALVVFVVMLVGGLRGVSSKLFYIFFGFIFWMLFLESGIHPTIAGVLVAFTVPAKPRIDVMHYLNTIRTQLKHFPEERLMGSGGRAILTHEQIDKLKVIESASDKVISPLQDLEDSLHSVINYIIMPLFAFANAGVLLSGFSISDLVSGVTLPVLIGLFVGKFVGIFSFTYAAVKLKIAPMLESATWSHIAGVSLLGGVGFTVSLFIANLSYNDVPQIGEELLNQAKLGVILGSLVSGLLGYLYLKKRLPKEV
ncbi:MAG: Na+/H+ antiporter NhaA [Bacteroidales bacterium]